MANIGLGTAAVSGKSYGAVIKTVTAVTYVPTTGQIWPRGGFLK